MFLRHLIVNRAPAIEFVVDLSQRQSSYEFVASRFISCSICVLLLKSIINKDGKVDPTIIE